MQLAPEALGEVRLQITRNAAGETAVSVQAERTDTLNRLQTDLAHLHQALDRAGVPEQRSVTLHLLPAHDAMTAGSFSLGQDTQGSGGQSGQGAFRPPSRPIAYPAAAEAKARPDPRPLHANSRSGLNITA